jgi:hypothetical protein
MDVSLEMWEGDPIFEKLSRELFERLGIRN